MPSPSPSPSTSAASWLVLDAPETEVVNFFSVHGLPSPSTATKTTPMRSFMDVPFQVSGVAKCRSRYSAIRQRGQSKGRVFAGRRAAPVFDCGKSGILRFLESQRSNGVGDLRELGDRGHLEIVGESDSRHELAREQPGRGEEPVEQLLDRATDEVLA